jgi:hypothetical protein
MSFVRVTTIQKIAKRKGLVFEYNETHNIYVMRDKLTNECIMTYAPVTVALITSDKVWREECNKLKTSVFR